MSLTRGKWVLMNTISVREYEQDREEYKAQILAGDREVYGEDGEEPLTKQQVASLSDEALNEFAEQEMGDDWSVGWAYQRTIPATGDLEIGVTGDRASATQFDTEEQAKAFFAAHFADDDGEWEWYEIQ